MRQNKFSARNNHFPGSPQEMAFFSVFMITSLEPGNKSVDIQVLMYAK
jgi:hypothetical protein